MSNGIIRDFAGPYYVSVSRNKFDFQIHFIFNKIIFKEDNMAFGLK